MKTSSGIIFDIHRFSLNDGPGIRTTVFLKGCPLECLWCHNPESQSFQPQLSFNPDKCKDCFKCVEACPNGVHQIINDKHSISWDECKTAGLCVSVCSEEALKIVGYEAAVNDIIREFKLDINYYKNSSGGLTISGGEPLAQFNFTKELLTAAKAEGIHTCIDTCGQAAQSHYHEILPLTDLFLFDYKMIVPDIHKNLTGVDNRLILKNFEFLYNKGAEIIVRCPIIPGVNDTQEHLNSIKELKIKYPKLKGIEILPYHSMGRNKNEQIGRPYLLKNITEPDEKKIQYWKSFI